MTLLESAKRKLANHKAIIFDDKANLIWRSDAWHSQGGTFTDTEKRRCHGTGWQEFIDHDDLVQVLAWLISPHTHWHITFQCMAPTTGQHHRCLWRKTQLGKKHWIVIGSYL